MKITLKTYWIKRNFEFIKFDFFILNHKFKINKCIITNVPKSQDRKTLD